MSCGRDRSEQPAVVAGLLRDRQHRAPEHAGILLRTLLRLPRGPLGFVAAPLGDLDRAIRRGLGQLAGWR